MDVMAVSKRLIDARGEKPQRVVAAAVNISVSALGMYESGKRIPRDDIKERLADYYGTTVGSLFFNENVT